MTTDKKTGFKPKELIKRQICDTLEIIWDLKPAYPHLRPFSTDDLIELNHALEYYKTKLATIKSKPGYAKQIINTVISLANNGKYDEVQ